MAKITSLPEIPYNLQNRSQMRRVLTGMRELLSSRVLPRRGGLIAVSNIQVTPYAGGVRVAFTPSNGDRYVVWHGVGPALDAATKIDIGKSTYWEDAVGAGGVGKWYWVGAVASGKGDGPLVGPVKATTLALGIATTMPRLPPIDDPYGFSKSNKQA